MGNNRSTSEICKICNIRTIKQKKYYYCAAASLKMSLNINNSQDDIYEELHASTKNKNEWYVDPDSIFAFLIKYGNYKKLSDISPSSVDATEWIVSNLIKNDSCAPMLVSSGKHWVVYAGYQMNLDGEPTGIYIKDPWPSTVSLNFFPFSNYFFDEYFTPISIPGPFENKVESFVPKNVSKLVSVGIYEKPKYGGLNSINDIKHFKKDIIAEDLERFGFINFEIVKNGGIGTDDIVINDLKDKPRFMLSFIELHDELMVSAIDLKNYSIIGLMEFNQINFKLFDKQFVKEVLKNKYNEDVEIGCIRYVYDKKYCNSCFTPLVKARGSYYDFTREIKYQGNL